MSLQSLLRAAYLSAAFHLATAAILTAGQPADDRTTLAPQVDKLFAPWDKLDSPGCAVGVVSHGKLIYERGFGTAHQDYEVPNSSTTVFEIGSFSKAFTCLDMALLMDEGKLSAEDDIRRFVPELHRFDPPIRIGHLIRCYSGLWDPWHALPLAGWDNVPIQSTFTKDDILTVLSGQRKLPFAPGSEFHYGSGDYFLLGLIVERASGQTLAEFERDRVFQPLEMHSTFREEDPSRSVRQRAMGHVKQRDGSWRLWTNHGYLPGGGGVKTNIRDLARWDRNFDHNILKGGSYVEEFFRSGTLLDNRFCLDADAYVKKVHPATAGTNAAGQYRGAKRIQFTGGVFGMAAGMARFPDHGLTILCLANTEDIAPWAKAEQIASIYLRDKLSAEPQPTVPEQREVSMPVDIAELSNKVGNYMTPDGTIFEVTLNDGKLWNTNPRGETYELKPLGKNRFLPTLYPQDTFVFERTTPQAPFELKLESGGNILSFQRVQLIDPKTIKLAEYVGEYFSAELSATYRFKVDDDALWLRINSRRWERLKPTLADEFIPFLRTGHENRRIRFRRNAEHQPSGLTISFWRVNGIDFERK